MDLLLVEGMPALRKDAQSGAVINTDRDALLAARKLKEARLAEQGKVKDLEDKVKQLESMLMQLLEGNANG